MAFLENLCDISFEISYDVSPAGNISAGVAIGCATTFLTDLWCPVAYVPHLLLGHLLPTIILGGIGAVLGRLVMAIKYE